MTKDFLKGANRAYLLGGLLVLAVLAFYLTRHPIFAFSGFLLLIALFLADIVPRKWNSRELAATAKELAVALFLALAVWLGLQLFLGTSAPIDVVTSCSMLPTLERGDMIVVQGGVRPSAPELQFSGTIEAALQNVQLGKSPCVLKAAGTPVQALCTQSVSLNGRTVEFKRDNDVIVFDATPRVYGLVVHRAFARLVNGTHEFYLTKGDNNLGIDQESGFSPIAPSDVKGVVRTRIPLLGFLKLFLFMQFEEPIGCSHVVQGGD